MVFSSLTFLMFFMPIVLILYFIKKDLKWRNYVLLAGNVALYLIVQVVKRIMEPKLLGAQMKLSQLATMVSMYAGYAMMGYIGLLIGPLMLKLFMAVLSSSIGQPSGKEPKETARKSRRKK